MQPSDIRRITELGSPAGAPSLTDSLRALAQDRGFPVEFVQAGQASPELLQEGHACVTSQRAEILRSIQALHAVSGGKVFVGAPVLCRGQSRSSLVLWPHEGRALVRSLEWTETSVLESQSLDALAVFAARMSQDHGLRLLQVTAGVTEKESYCSEYWQTRGFQPPSMALAECVQAILGAGPIGDGSRVAEPSLFVASPETGALLSSIARSESRLAWGDRAGVVAWMKSERAGHLAMGWVLDHLGLMSGAAEYLGKK